MSLGEPVILTHPNNANGLRGDLLPVRSGPAVVLTPLARMNVRYSLLMPRTFPRGRWAFPRERFWKYDAEDELWCRPLGVGRIDAVPAAPETNHAVIWTGRPAMTIVE